MGSELYFFFPLEEEGGGGSFLRKGVQEKVTLKGIRTFLKVQSARK